MPKERKFYTQGDGPAPCRVDLPPALAQYVYREFRARGYRTATELVVDIVRRWAEDLDPMDSRAWKKLLAQIKTEEAAEEDAEGEAKTG